MTAARVLRGIARLVVVLVLCVSGVYLIVYLFRWEWNRALVAGIFFVAAEVAVVGSTIMGRLRVLEQSIAAGGPRGDGGRPASTISDENRGVSRSFAWLRDASGRTGVFIPVLLGAGVILSAVAYLVERVAGSLSGPSVDRAMARRLALDLPSGGLVIGGSAHEHRSVTGGARTLVAPPPRRAVVVTWTLVAGLAVALAIMGVGALKDLTESRPEPAPEGTATAIDLRIVERRTERPVSQSAEGLWIACRSTVHDDVVLTDLTKTGADTVTITLAPPLGELAGRRLRGCLGDVTLDLVRAEVLGFRTLGDSEPAEEVGAPTPA